MNHTSFNTLDNCWRRTAVMKKLKNGVNPDSIVDDFIRNTKQDLEIVSDLLKKNSNTLYHLEKLNYCEMRLIEFLREENNNKQNNNMVEITKKDFLSELKIFLLTWSNKCVISILIMISLISLIRQA